LLGSAVGGWGRSEQQSELVATEARDCVTRAYAGAEARSDLHKYRVAGLVAEGVVDRLEAVQVHEQHRSGAAIARGTPKCLLYSVIEQHAVR
jgi:hypothetical protein